LKLTGESHDETIKGRIAIFGGKTHSGVGIGEVKAINRKKP
jgi:hypothetical protein